MQGGQPEYLRVYQILCSPFSSLCSQGFGQDPDEAPNQKSESLLKIFRLQERSASSTLRPLLLYSNTMLDKRLGERGGRQSSSFQSR